MMKRALVVLISVLLFAGCVSSKEYKARLSDIDNLEADVSSLQGQLKAAEAENAKLTVEVQKLRKSEAELIEANAELARRMESDKLELVRENTDLKAGQRELEFRVNELQDELAVKKAEIDRLTGEVETLSVEAQKAIQAKKQAVAELQGTYNELVSELNDEIQKGRIAVKQLKDKLSLSMVDKVLFDSGSSEVKRQGRKVLDTVAEILKKVTDKQIRIEGHTDNVAIGPKLAKKFPTNWELSTARANNVVRYLTEEGGVDPDLLSAAGYSMYRPVAPNDTEEDRAKNRRIEIVLIPIDIDRVAEEQVPAAAPAVEPAGETAGGETSGEPETGTETGTEVSQ